MFDYHELRERSTKAAGTDVSFASDSELFEAAVALDEARGLIEAAQAHVLERLHTEATTDREHGHRTARWLASEANAPRARCAARMRTAEKLMAWFPEFDQAVCGGRLGWQHVELLCSVANPRNFRGFAEMQEHLIVLAGQFGFDDWAALVRQLASELDEDGGYDPNDDVHANRLRLSPNGDRTIELAGRLVGSARATVDQTLEAVADELFARFARDHEQDPELEVPGRATLLALALEEVCTRARSIDLESTEKPRVEAVVVIEQGDDGAELRSPDGTRLPDAAAAVLSDAVIQPLVVDGEGSPLRYGRSRRLATPRQRLALAVRDGVCIVPGCDVPPGHCDAHHEPPWDRGGHTDTASMGLLCRHHHRVTHRPGWRIEPDPDRAERWIWTTPSGRRLHSQRHRDRRPPRPPLPGTG